MLVPLKCPHTWLNWNRSRSLCEAAQLEASRFEQPAIADVVQQVDLVAGRIVVALLDGMEPVPVAAPALPRARSPKAKRQREAEPKGTPAEVKPLELESAETSPPEARATALEGASHQE